MNEVFISNITKNIYQTAQLQPSVLRIISNSSDFQLESDMFIVESIHYNSYNVNNNKICYTLLIWVIFVQSIVGDNLPTMKKFRSGYGQLKANKSVDFVNTHMECLNLWGIWYLT